MIQAATTLTHSGRVQAVRDERGRIVSQNAFYPAGDN